MRIRILLSVLATFIVVALAVSQDMPKPAPVTSDSLVAQIAEQAIQLRSQTQYIAQLQDALKPCLAKPKD